jgi:hypothetical protein
LVFTGFGINIEGMCNISEKDEEREKEEVDALCLECGHAFKKYIDIVADKSTKSDLAKKVECPVCGCGECDIIQPGT